MPVVLHEAREGRFFLCHHCYEKTTDLLCSNCGSWKLDLLGVGIEGLASQMRKSHPDLTLEVASSDKGKKVNTESQFVLVTETLLPQITTRFNTVVVAYVDSLLALPEFRIRERVYRRITEARNLATHNFLVQTRRIEDSIFAQAINGDVSGFRVAEMKARKRFGYPPTMHIIKITASGSTTNVKKLVGEVTGLLAKWTPLFVPPNHVIIRQQLLEWPNLELLNLLLPLRARVRVELDPQSIM